MVEDVRAGGGERKCPFMHTFSSPRESLTFCWDIHKVKYSGFCTYKIATQIQISGKKFVVPEVDWLFKDGWHRFLLCKRSFR